MDRAGELRGTTVGAPSDHGASCDDGSESPEVVYVLEVDEPSQLCLSTAGSAYDTVVHVRADECWDAAAEIACSDDAPLAGALQSAVTVDAVPGTVYYVFVDGYGDEAGDYVLDVSAGRCGAGPPGPCDGDEDCGGGEVCVDGACVPGCRDHADCLDGEACVDGVCAPGCREDRDCAEGEVCFGGRCGPPPGACADPVAIDRAGAWEGTTVGAPSAQAGSCGGEASPEVVYAIALNEPVEVCLSTAGSGFDTVLHVRADDCVDAAAEVACNDDSLFAGGRQSAVTLEARAGVVYYVFVDGVDEGQLGAYALDVSRGRCGAPPECEEDGACGVGEICLDGACVAGCRDDGGCDVGAVCLDGACVAGCRDDGECEVDEVCVDGECRAPPPGTCEDPVLLERVGEVQGTTVGAPADHQASCGGGAGSPEVVYVAEVPEPMEVCLTTVGSGYDTVLHVRADDCRARAAEVACNDDEWPGIPSAAVTLNAEPGVRYYVFVDGFGDDSEGPFTLTTARGPCAEPPGCVDDGDCDLGELCLAGVCVPGGCLDIC